MTVGAVPAVPAGERSWLGIEAIVDDPAPPLEDGWESAVVVAEAAVVVVVAVDELPHAASAQADRNAATNDQLRRRDTEQSFREQIDLAEARKAASSRAFQWRN